MTPVSLPVLVGVALVAAGCASGPSYLDAARPEAIEMAQRRAVAELGCQDSKGEVTASEVQLGPPPQSVAYRVLVSGCGQRRAFVVQCQETRGCIPGAGRPAP